jgi:hypothetical protein
MEILFRERDERKMRERLRTKDNRVGKDAYSIRMCVMGTLD